MKTLSGGQKRRLDLGIALVGDPDLVFLDEPTTGFDPAARRSAWDTIRSLRSLGKTVLLTTHYLDEAQQLADRVAVLRGGEVVRIGAPAELIGAVAAVEIRYRENGRDVVLETDEPTRTLHELTSAALPPGASSRVSRCAGRPSRTSTSSWSARRSGRDAAHASTRRRAARLLAQPGGRVLRLPLPDRLPAPARVGLRRHDRRLRGERSAARRPARLRRGQHGVRRPRHTPRIRRESGLLKRIRATPLPATTYLLAALLSMLVVFLLQSVAMFALEDLDVRRGRPGRRRLAARGDAARRRGVCGHGFRRGGADPLL